MKWKGEGGEGTSSGPVARTARYLFPGLFVDLLDIFGHAEPSAALRAAQRDAASTEGKAQRALAVPTLQTESLDLIRHEIIVAHSVHFCEQNAPHLEYN